MPFLTPSSAAEIARGVYRLREDSISTVRDERGQLLGCEGMFAPGNNARFEGRSGAIGMSRLTGFGYIAAGEGQFAGDVLLATRGTAMRLDWLSNINIGLQRGPGGYPVHAGFNEVWKSAAPEIRAFMRNRNPTRIHCVGHSLGGAVATLNADLLSLGGIADVALYTFGSPRTGDGLFARSLTQRVGAAKIFRVSHHADPVPMIPLFPFWHLPNSGGGYRIGAESKALISVGAHSMGPSYIPAMANASWAGIAAAAVAAAEDEAGIKSWLERTAEGHGSALMGSASLLTMIGRALAWVLKAAGKIVLGGLGVGLTVGATVLDQLASLLSRGAELSRELGGHVKTLMRAIFTFLGRSATTTAALTTAFVHWTLDLLFSALRAVAVRAVNVFD